ncbi:MAG TPA: hypothetical protein VK427_00775 [Kofleriaceae bacterium]|nr:hypothetical protein [Kofleriaceae bacterium]
MKKLALGIVLLAACGPDSRRPPVDAGGDATVTVDSDLGPPIDAVASITAVYAHTASQLYRVDPDTLNVVLVGDFSFTGPPDQITDLAIDRSGLMIGISFTAVYRIDPTTAACTLLAEIVNETLNGLSFVPASDIGQTGPDILVATRNATGAVSRIDPMTGAVSPLGNTMGFRSSGDLVSVAGFGTVLTADNGVDPDKLVRLAPNTFTATPIGTTIGFADIWGVAYWGDKIFGFTEAGQFITIDPQTGTGTLIQGNGPRWWGAAVNTLAPVIL